MGADNTFGENNFNPEQNDCKGEWVNDCPWPFCKCAQKIMLENQKPTEEQKEEFYSKYDEDYSADQDRLQMWSGCRKGIWGIIAFILTVIALLIWLI